MLFTQSLSLAVTIASTWGQDAECLLIDTKIGFKILRTLIRHDMRVENQQEIQGRIGAPDMWKRLHADDLLRPLDDTAFGGYIEL